MAWSRAKLKELLGSVPRVDEGLNAAIRRAGLVGDSFSREQVLELLEDLCQDPGVLGIAARFAKVKVLLAREG